MGAQDAPDILFSVPNVPPCLFLPLRPPRNLCALCVKIFLIEPRGAYGGKTMSAVIVIFGAAVRADGSPTGTLVRRVRSAWLFGRGREDVVYVVAGGSVAGRPPEWPAMRRLLLEAGVPDERIIAEPAGTDTLSEVRNCAAILRQRGASAVWIATSRYHQPRCRLLFRLMGLSPRIVPALPDRPELPLWQLLFFWAREIPALPFDAVLTLAARLRGKENF
jgi:uncharacterized SAM-binding protein YcdF (DUF218 family)